MQTLGFINKAYKLPDFQPHVSISIINRTKYINALIYHKQI